MRLKSGSVIFIMHHDSKLSRLIAWFMGTKWCHSALVVETSRREIWLSETTDTQVAYGAFTRYFYDPNCSFEAFEPLDCTKKEQGKCIEAAKQNVGRLYAYHQLLSWALSCLLARAGFKLKNLLPYGLICNSHVLTGIRCFKSGPFYNIKPQSIHTGQMYELMKKSKAWKSVWAVNNGGC